MANPVTKQDIQDALDQRESDNAFGVSLIPYHTHNGVDSPPVSGSGNAVVQMQNGIVGGGKTYFGDPTPGFIFGSNQGVFQFTVGGAAAYVSWSGTALAIVGVRFTKRVLALSANSATPAVDTDLYDVVHITAQSTAITSFSSGLTGTPVDGDTLRVSITGTTAVAITWGSSFEASTVPLPTTTVTTARLDVGFFWNTETSAWRCIGSA